MELPLRLRHAVDRALSGRRPADLAAAAAALSQRYREERRDGRLHVASDEDALAYLAVRLPATYAAVRASFAAIERGPPGFCAEDRARYRRRSRHRAVGGGRLLARSRRCAAGRGKPGFSGLRRSSSRARLPCRTSTWRTADVAADAIDCPPRDLVTLAYALNELAPEVRQSVLQRLWRATADTLVIVEPGTPAGWQRIVTARAQLIESRRSRDRALSARLCLPARAVRRPTGVISPQRVARSRLHRHAKEADGLGKTRISAIWRSRAGPRRPPRRASSGDRAKGSGRVTLKLCRDDGSAGEHLFSRRDGTLFKRAWRSDWGSAL